MPFKHHDAHRHHIPKAKYLVRNWSAYNAGLCQRGSLTVWLSSETIDGWKAPKREGRGGQPMYSDSAIEAMLMLGAVYHLPLRQTRGLTNETLNLSAGERVRGDLHIQTVNSRHERLKTFLRRYRGIATKYLDSYLKWFHLVGIQLNPSPRACLNAALGLAR